MAGSWSFWGERLKLLTEKLELFAGKLELFSGGRMGWGELLEGTGRGVEGMVGGLERCLFCDEGTLGLLMRRAGLHGRWLPWVEGCARKLEFPGGGLVFAGY